LLLQAILDNLMQYHNFTSAFYMSNHKILSENEEMYLVTIRRIFEQSSDAPIPIAELAKEMGIQPVSANQMVNKLAENGLVSYIPYKGVDLTPEGYAISTRILRHRRLWEVFLVKSLGIDLETADQLACQFEHYTPPDVADRLSRFLDDPAVCFHGNPIPVMHTDGQNSLLEDIPAADLQIGRSGPVMHIHADPVTTKFLADGGIRAGIEIRLVAMRQNGDLLLETPSGHVSVTEKIALGVIVGIQNKVKSREHQEQRSAEASNA
jgi:DtxR family Mn-dependent transcriptional regulator